jgi:SAM-dependent methyltransferase
VLSTSKKQESAFVQPRFPIRKSELDRFKFGKQRYNEIVQLKKDGFPFCLDIACGAKPFPKADILCDLNVKPCLDRSMNNLVTSGKPFVLCNCYNLPFKDKAFDFITSYYLIEHIERPWNLLKEIKRVSNYGYIQCPSWFSELLYNESVHNWTIFKHNNNLYIKPIKKGSKTQPRFGFIFHKLYRSKTWQVIHAILDEKFHLFSIKYNF